MDPHLNLSDYPAYKLFSYFRPSGNPEELKTQLKARACYLACSTVNLPPCNYIEMDITPFKWHSTQMEGELPDNAYYLMNGYILYGKLSYKFYKFNLREGIDPRVMMYCDLTPKEEQVKYWETLDSALLVKTCEEFIMTHEHEPYRLDRMRVITWKAFYGAKKASLGYELKFAHKTYGELKYKFRTVGTEAYLKVKWADFLDEDYYKDGDKVHYFALDQFESLELLNEVAKKYWALIKKRNEKKEGMISKALNLVPGSKVVKGFFGGKG